MPAPRSDVARRALRSVMATGRMLAGALLRPFMTIGAGDAFTAGYLSGMLDGVGVEERLHRGAACGALAVTGEGDWEQAPTRADLARLESVEAAR